VPDLARPPPGRAARAQCRGRAARSPLAAPATFPLAVTSLFFGGRSGPFSLQSLCRLHSRRLRGAGGPRAQGAAAAGAGARLVGLGQHGHLARHEARAAADLPEAALAQALLDHVDGRPHQLHLRAPAHPPSVPPGRHRETGGAGGCGAPPPPGRMGSGAGRRGRGRGLGAAAHPLRDLGQLLLVDGVIAGRRRRQSSPARRRGRPSDVLRGRRPDGRRSRRVRGTAGPRRCGARRAALGRSVQLPQRSARCGQGSRAPGARGHSPARATGAHRAAGCFFISRPSPAAPVCRGQSPHQRAASPPARRALAPRHRR